MNMVLCFFLLICASVSPVDLGLESAPGLCRKAEGFAPEPKLTHIFVFDTRNTDIYIYIYVVYNAHIYCIYLHSYIHVDNYIQLSSYF